MSLLSVAATRNECLTALELYVALSVFTFGVPEPSMHTCVLRPDTTKTKHSKCDVIGTCWRQKELNFQYRSSLQPISGGLSGMSVLPSGAEFYRKQPYWSFSLAFRCSKTQTQTHTHLYKHAKRHQPSKWQCECVRRKEGCLVKAPE